MEGPGTRPDRLEGFAQQIAESHQFSERFKSGIWLLKRLRDQEVILLSAYHLFQKSAEVQLSISTAGEWLLDNYYVIQQTLQQVHQDMPGGFYRRLPKLTAGNFVNYPRTFGLAWALVNYCQSQLELEQIFRFVQTYQCVHALKISELWALPTMLRLSIMESLTQALAKITNQKYPGLPTQYPPAPDVNQEIVVANCIISFRMLATLDWKAFFERLSRVEEVLLEDPAGVYAQMEFETRDRYRRVVEEIALWLGMDEARVAAECVAIAKEAEQSSGNQRGQHLTKPRSAHVGYYLIDSGRPELENRLGCRLPQNVRVSRWVLAHPLLVYLGSIFIPSCLIILGMVAYARESGGGWLISLAAGVLVFNSVVAAVILFVNRLVINYIPPRPLPRIEFKDGIPAKRRTMVVIPSLLSNPGEVQSLIHQLELHYLNNPDPNLTFALLSDFVDAPAEQMPDDAQLLEQAETGIRMLNIKYDLAGKGPFFLFHRQRKWSQAENSWMGWERKRGKLIEFNRLALGQQDTSFIVQMGNLEILPELRYVITLDADTILPRDAAKRLVATISHPLNQADFESQSGKLCDGYTILQPRVQVKPTSANRSLFTRVYAGDSGLDLYSRVVSEVYQDLFGEGNYVGKGLYDLSAFHQTLEGKIPENHIVSHDLLEGVHGRVALVSDIVIYEDYPPHWVSYIRRLHRWVRGDWQLLPWLLPKVPYSGIGLIQNELSWLDRWKILDNLRRSQLWPAVWVMLIAGWFFLPGSALVWTAAALLPLIVPILLPFFSGLFTRLDRWKLKQAFHTVWGEMLRSLLMLAFLPHRALVMIDAMVTSLARMTITHKRMLQWSTAAHNVQLLGVTLVAKLAWQEMFGEPIYGLGLAFLLAVFRPVNLFVAGPFFLAWLASPYIVTRVCYIQEHEPVRLEEAQLKHLRSLANRTWLFFRDFVDPDDHWLPPDHFQEEPRGLVAHHTSPTNIGLGLLSTLAAYDLGYIDFIDLSLRLRSTFDTLEKLESYRGHIFNWYDTRSLEPLLPKYISTVDSGNLAGSLVALRQACQKITHNPVLRWQRFEGLSDTLGVLQGILSNLPENCSGDSLGNVQKFFREIDERIWAVRNDRLAWPELLSWLSVTNQENLDQIFMAFLDERGHLIDITHLRDLRYWVREYRQQLDEWIAEIDILAPWIHALSELPDYFIRSDITQELKEEWQAFQEALPAEVTLHELPGVCINAREHLERLISLLPTEPATDPETKNIDTEQAIEATNWCRGLAGRLDTSITTANGVLSNYTSIASQAEEFFQKMEFGFLFDPQRQVFYLGYNLTSGKVDSNHYDLLASEARLASLLAIAKGDVPQTHWMHLARPLTPVDSIRTLISWSGTMFEYLMPHLLVRNYPDTLMGQSSQAVVDHQIDYATRKGVPWGISESGYYHFDNYQNYQYRAFGVPGLGYKRGLEEDLVITPYASLLALPIRPQQVTQNIAELERYQMIGAYGFYEAIDFTTSRLPKGMAFGIVGSYLAHHQGMILLSLTNYLLDGIMLQRFHADPRVESVELLMQEQVPSSAPLEYPQIIEQEVVPYSQTHLALLPWQPWANLELPMVHCLSNGRYSVLITNAGAGYSQWEDQMLTRWRSDTTLDDWGTWIYIRDTTSGAIWSPTVRPGGVSPDSQEVRFYPHKVEFDRRDGEISSQMVITVAPRDDVEIRRLTLTNHGKEPRRLTVTSYAEVVLAPYLTDLRHQAFNKLFIQSEYLPELNALLFTRRPRASDEKPVHLGHLLVAYPGSKRDETSCGYESERGAFLGRGGMHSSPAILAQGNPCRNGTTGETLDPVFSLSQEVALGAGASLQLAFVTLSAQTRQQALELARMYQDWEQLRHSVDEAYIFTEQELKELDLVSKDLERYQVLLSALLYPHADLRTTPARLAANTKGQSSLWRLAISGDYPILLLRVSEPEQVPLVRDLLLAHAYWRKQGILVDLVILNQHETGYEEELQSQLYRLLERNGSNLWLNQRGGVFLLKVDQVGETDLVLLETAARAILDGQNGPLEDQIKALTAQPIRLPRFPFSSKLEESKPTQLEQPVDLLFNNGFGGFTPDGREYVIYLEGKTWTPAPWINVIANPQFGFIASESSLGCTWAVNSGENRLTPWHNDPLRDPPSEVVYLRDEQNGEFWSATPLPVREPEPYLVRHGAGYSIFEHHSHGLKQRLRVFSVPDAPLKIVQMSLHNTRQHNRQIVITYYADWVLGTTRQDTAPYLIPEFNPTYHALLARNPYNVEFGQRVAFMAATREPYGLTANRSEFLGRLGSYRHPDALDRVGLTARVQAGMDTCAALQVILWLSPGETKEVTYLLGQGADKPEALSLIGRYQDIGQVIDAWERVGKLWDGLLGDTVVRTPDPALDILFNRWLVYQTLSCRVWGRTALYQSSGAYGFRDQLQDVLALAHTQPQITRDMILNAAAHQFNEGDVLHWWHPPSPRGVRSRCSDDLLWLPYITAGYTQISGDETILNEPALYLEGPLLGEEEAERYDLYRTSESSGSIYEHCLRALDLSLSKGKFGVHGLPLIGSSDWNDGMNRVGIEGKGESVWLGWFLLAVLESFTHFLEQKGDQNRATRYRQRFETLQQALESNAWDGLWYLRAFFDDGTPLGSAQNDECQIDGIAQAWAVLSGAASDERTRLAMKSVARRLVRKDDQLIALFDPPFNHTRLDPGYIKGYPPGIRENGGQYTHGAVWEAWAFGELGLGNQLGDLLRLLNPIYHSDSPQKAGLFQVEPYVMPADVYSQPPYTGRGGWTWYTGSAGWMYRLCLEVAFGIKRVGGFIKIDPCIPGHWKEFSLNYRTSETLYAIQVENPAGVEHGVRQVWLDGKPQPDQNIPVIKDGKHHSVRVLMG